jgi:hypothetical protein
MPRQHENHPPSPPPSLKLRWDGKATTGQEAFITDTNEINRITKNLNIPNQRAPPDLRFSSPLAA